MPTLVSKCKCSNYCSCLLFKNCPNCKAPVYKYSGCNKIKCVCGISWCYFCGLPYRNKSQKKQKNIQVNTCASINDHKHGHPFCSKCCEIK